MRELGLCSCEHVDHFEVTRTERGVTTTTPPRKHHYGRVDARVALPTSLGEFNVCQDCADTCLKGLI